MAKEVYRFVHPSGKQYSLRSDYSLWFRFSSWDSWKKTSVGGHGLDQVLDFVWCLEHGRDAYVRQGGL